MFLTAHNLKQFGNVLHGFSLRYPGFSLPPYDGLNFSFSSGDKKDLVEKNFRLLASRLGISTSSFFWLQQVHGDQWLELTAANIATLKPAEFSGDILLTREKGITLSVRTADCLSALLLAPDIEGIAAVHAGWRGVKLGVVNKAVQLMSDLWQADPKKLRLAIGPSIGGCCLTLPTKLLGEDYSKLAVTAINSSLVSLDLKMSCKEQALAAGLDPQHIEIIDICNSCQPKLCFSYRREGISSGRHLNFIHWMR